LEPGKALPCTHQRPGAFEIPFLNEGVGIGHTLRFTGPALGFQRARPFGGISKGNALGEARQRLS
jgi:hypothetical protein